jgi:hypothetical protein
MIRQARTGDTLLGKSKEMTGRTQTLSRWLEGRGVKTTENKTHWSRRHNFLLTFLSPAALLIYVEVNQSQDKRVEVWRNGVEEEGRGWTAGKMELDRRAGRGRGGRRAQCWNL